MSRSKAAPYARRWWASVVGCAGWRWVKPGMTVSTCAVAVPTRTRRSAQTSPASARSSSRRRRRRQVATSSFRERPTWSRPPASSPTIAVRWASIPAWTSSYARVVHRLGEAPVPEDEEAAEESPDVRRLHNPLAAEHQHVGEVHEQVRLADPTVRPGRREKPRHVTGPLSLEAPAPHHIPHHAVPIEIGMRCHEGVGGDAVSS